MADPKNQFLIAQNITISDETQQMLNQPPKDPQGLSAEDSHFLVLLMDKIDKKEIDLYRPSTLLNMRVYDQLNETQKGKADFDAVNLLNTIREIRKLWDAGHRDTYQIENLTHQIRLTKERLEDMGGDIFII